MERRYRVPRSCIRCHGRKIKCNKEQPCSTCVKSGVESECSYPAGERVRRRPPRTSAATSTDPLRASAHAAREDDDDESSSPGPIKKEDGENASVQSIAKVQRELERLEKIVSQHRANGNKTSLAERKAQRGSSSRSEENTTGMLAKDGSSSIMRYVNDKVLSLLVEKDEELLAALTTSVQASAPTEASDSPAGGMQNAISPGTATQYLGSLISMALPNSPSSQSTTHLHPPRPQAIQLWNTFVTYVDPLMKVIHVPTLQPLIFNAIKDPASAPPDLRALLFAIYFGAVTSVPPEDGDLVSKRYDEKSKLQEYRQGLEMSLAEAGFLEDPTLNSLRALLIFLIVHRSYGSGRSIWTLNGILIRAAQLIGLHKDGKHFGLSPFECEMRRRIWWRITSTDGRVLEDQGFWIKSSFGDGEVDLPGNLDDRDFGPDTKELPENQDRYTEMTMSLVVAHFQSTMAEVLQVIHAPAPDGAGEDYNKKKAVKLVNESIQRVHDKYLQYCDPDVPIQKMTILLAKVVLGKIRLMAQIGLANGPGGGDVNKKPKSNSSGKDARAGKDKSVADSVGLEAAFEDCIVTLRYGNEMLTDEMFAQFWWHTSSFAQYQLLTFAFWRLCMRPDHPSADRAWHEIELAMSTMERMPDAVSKGPRWQVIQKLYTKASSLRRVLKADEMGKADEQRQQRSQQKQPQSHQQSQPQPLPPQQQSYQYQQPYHTPQVSSATPSVYGGMSGIETGQATAASMNMTPAEADVVMGDGLMDGLFDMNFGEVPWSADWFSQPFSFEDQLNSHNGSGGM